MVKSNDKKGSLPKLDYSKIPAEIEEAINKQPYVINKSTKLTWDGRQFIIRVPKEIAEEMELSDEYHANFTFTKPLPNEKDKTLKLEIKLVR